jgi:hypothetical protein
MTLGDLSEEEVERIRTGAIGDPTVGQIAALASVFGVEPQPQIIRGTFRRTAPAWGTIHQVVNRSDTPCTYLVFGSRAVPDLTHYPDRGEILHDFDDRGGCSAPTGP